MTKVSVLEKKIYYHDTDAGAVVYYANYLKHLEEGRTEFCAESGVDTAALSKQGIFFVVSRIEVDYKASAHYGDKIKVHTQIEKVGRITVHYLQRITRGTQLLVEARVTWVCVDSKFKPISIPDGIKQVLTKQ